MTSSETKAPTERHIDQFAFVLNVGNLVGSDTIEIIPGHVLRRATAAERQTITSVVSSIPGNIFPLRNTLWEMAWPPTGPIRRLRPEEWRYWVIAFEGYNDALLPLQEAFDLGPLELEVGFTIFEGSSLSYHPARFFHVLQEVNFSFPTFFIDVSISDVEAVRTIQQKLSTHDHGRLDLRPLIAQVRALKALQHGSALRFLGYFAVLEALLTHAPKPEDPYDSITRQLKKKLALLNNRWIPQLNYEGFGGASADRVWSAMYSYRSKIAHGASVDFADADLRILGDRERPLRLIIDTVKAAMRHALDEPQLVVDLREC